MAENHYENLFILGAGASKPYGYPTGFELRNTILKECCTSTGDIARILQKLGWNLKHIENFGKEFRDSTAISIDAFLTIRQDLADIAKQAIAICILRNEENEDSHYPIEGNWIQYLINNFIGLSEESFRSKKLNFLSFNYDRSLQRILFRSVQSLFKLNDVQATSLLLNNNFHHFYGQLGYLPEFDSNGFKIPFGASIGNHLLYESVAREIKVITDERQNGFDQNIQDYFYHSKNIYILGFGFDSLNLRRLNIKWEEVPGKVYATAFGLSDLEIGRIRRKMNLVKKTVYFENTDCLGLLRKHLV